MKQKKNILLILAFAVIIAMTFTSWESVKAQTKTTTLKKHLVAGESLLIHSGPDGVYFYKPAYTGTVVLTRTEPYNTKKLLFTQPWLTIELFDKKGNAITDVKGLTYVLFSLNKEERAAWDNGELNIYQFNVEKQIWQKCETSYIGGLGFTYGRVMCQVLNTYSTYGLTIRK